MKTYLKGSFWKRLMAFIIDEVLLFIGLFILFFILETAGVKSGGVEKIIFWILSIVYNVIFLQKWGATIGKKLLKLRVVNTDYQPVAVGQILLRESVGKIYSSLLFNLGFLYVLKHPQRQAWHDKIAKTYVVEVDSNGQFISVAEEKVSKKDIFFYWILFIVAIIPILLVILVIFYLFFASPNQIKGTGMAPNYTDGQYVLTDKITYRTGLPQRRDVIIFPDVKKRGFDNIKRIVGLPGERVRLSGGKVYINGIELDESAYLSKLVNTGPESFLADNQEMTVPDNQYFVLGDNRLHSSDSRDFGFVPKESIIGKVKFCYWNCNSSK